MVYTAKINGTGYVVAIAGIRDTKITNINKTFEQTQKILFPCQFQFFNADLIAGWEHLYYAAVNAVMAFETGINVSRNLEIEILLYATGQDQISKGLQIIGISIETPKIAFLVMGKEQKEVSQLCEKVVNEIGVADDTVLSISIKKLESLKEVFQINENAIMAVGGDKLEAITSLVIEKGALLPLRR